MDRRHARSGEFRISWRRRRITSITQWMESPPLRESLAKKLAEENGISLNEYNALVVTAGGNMAFFNALAAIADPGDEIILPVPYYFNHEMAISIALLPAGARCRRATIISLTFRPLPSGSHTAPGRS